MDLRKLDGPAKLQLCKTYFYTGFAALPFLWVVNFVWFFREAFLVKPEYGEQSKIRTFTIFSGIGAAIVFSLLITWAVYFQIYRATLSWGDSLSFIIPIGRA